MKGWVILGALCAFVAPALGFWHGASAAVVTFSTVQIGGAGAVTGVSRNADGSKLLARTDQYGCYLKTVGGGKWTQLIRYDTFPFASKASYTSNGFPRSPACDAAEFAPSDSNTIWLGADGGVYKSTNGGASFSTTCYPQYSTPGSSSGHSDPLKAYGPFLGVDPNNVNIVYMSTPSAGLQFTYNAGANCSLISGVGRATSINGVGAGHLVAFDTSGGTISTGIGFYNGLTRTKNIYISTYGTGVYKSTDGGQTWTLLNSAGMPTKIVTMKADPFGRLLLVDDSYAGSGKGLGYLNIYNGAWTIPTDISAHQLFNGVDYDPNNCSTRATCRITGIKGGGSGASGMAVTVNGGTNWVSSTSFLASATGDATWVATWLNSSGFGWYTGMAAYDNSGKVWTGGEGTFQVTPISSNGATIAIQAAMAGIEESLASSVVTSPNTSGKVSIGTWDVNCFVNLAMPYNTYPTDANRGCYSTNANQLQRSYSMDWASADPSFFLALTDNQQGYGGGVYANFSGSSSNGGATWTTSISPPSLVVSGTGGGALKGGCIAAASSTNFLWAPTDGSGGNVAPFYTTNAGASWTQISVSRVTGGWPFQYYNNSKQCAADRDSINFPNTFYLFNWNDGAVGDAIIRCTAGGASCSIVSRPSMGANSQYSGVIKTVPGKGQHLFLASGGNDPPDLASGKMVYSTNGGRTLITVAKVTNVQAFGFGAPFPGHTYPAIVFVGGYNGQYGIWQSSDWDGAKTWQKIGDYPKNMLSAIKDVDGDKVIPNVFYYTGSSGTYCSATSTSHCSGSP